jgi:hypothetical protein
MKIARRMSAKMMPSSRTFWRSVIGTAIALKMSAKTKTLSRDSERSSR